EIAETIIAKKRRNIVLTDSSKFGQIYPSSIGKTDEISVLLTDKAAPKSDLEQIKKRGVEVILG
ncbi:DeoR family transcriptional regulator, partial [Escherichia coli]|nr:DeoR family transcriptional regulator [Escherichia coli]